MKKINSYKTMKIFFILCIIIVSIFLLQINQYAASQYANLTYAQYKKHYEGFENTFNINKGFTVKQLEDLEANVSEMLQEMNNVIAKQGVFEKNKEEWKNLASNVKKLDDDIIEYIKEIKAEKEQGVQEEHDKYEEIGTEEAIEDSKEESEKQWQEITDQAEKAEEDYLAGLDGNSGDGIQVNPTNGENTDIPEITDPTQDPNSYKPGETTSTKATTMAGNILGAINAVGVVVSVVAFALIGIRYMLGSVEERANYKETMVPYLIGAVLLFATTTIVNVLYKFASGINGV